jgi:peptidoglycan/xylan/chitin deacetylase (PgdA/CDA1 family)
MRVEPLASAVIVLHQTPPRFRAAPMSMSIPALRRIVTSLLAQGFRFVSLDDVDAAGARPGTVALTADDGYASQRAHLGPFLRELGIPWTVFVLAGMLGKENDWDHPWISPRERHLTADEVRELAGEGVTIGSHGMSHANMTALGDAALREELERSRELLRRVSGQSVDAVAYPWGLADDRVVEASRRAGYRLGFGTDVGRGGRTSSSPPAGSSHLITRLGLYSPDQLAPSFAAAAIGRSNPLRTLRCGLERWGQRVVGLAMSAQAGPHA